MKINVLLSAFLIILFASCTDKSGFEIESGDNWPVYLGGNNSAQYSSLQQINSSNIHKLEKAWEYSTGDFEENDRTQIQCNPIIIDGIMYGTSPKLKAFALDAATGTELWKFDPQENISNFGFNVNRGVSYWQSGNDKRILYTAGSNL
ncbi:MAG: pyrroloquinoline quinone-dependent dehydrogenase, partial [Cyclobacteriaceae bacterium]